MAELRAGGLAIIIHSGRPENIGRVVLTVSLEGGASIKRGERTWFIRTCSGESLIARKRKSGKLSHPTECFCAEWRLMPIDGDDFSNEDQYQKEQEHD
ncbi:hypothetical protein HV234_07225 [Klebsiella grimontii]|uniref:Uncharacterized protein n=1 Tax=Klebsiella grimontii TaxID=2058152 RepID=A0ABD7AF58_9ENTR|nr:hypothetical protein [Klebsiella grimontii]QLO51331.1 hypothetical protein HV234_07225 [Klebsiella grimontii]